MALAVATRADAADPPSGTVVAAEINATRTCQDHLGVPRSKSGNPWQPHSRAYRTWQLNHWRTIHHKCQAALDRKAYEWNWQAWLPDKWRRIGVCETGLDFHFTNSQYVSAFGIARSSWAAFRPAYVPAIPELASPWQQWQVALAIYNRYGFSGWGCRNA